MKVIDILEKASGPLFSFELVPPLCGGDIRKIHDAIEPLMEFAPPFINITFHRDEEEFRQRPDGGIERVVVTKRPGSVALAAAIMKRFRVEVVPHVICGGASRHAIENVLIDLHFLDIENVMALRGDPLPGQRFFVPEEGGHRYCNELVGQIARMNRGQYLDDSITDAVATNFCIGVAGYPEKHYEAPNRSTDIENLKRKVDAGAAYIVTQMFFDNAAFFRFVDACRAAGITVPIIPGIKPISTARHLEMLPRVFNIDIPEPLVRAIRRCANNAAVNQVGIEWAVEQGKELVARGVPAVHYYTMGSPNNIREIVRQVF
ncbi:MAG: methylenetetrahydrofolate reductase [NAD(P)H] [Odoribacteraceae bacterium]|jgi:methylenetetrahydrofolate reductase (NADPH)|nr:methylenetetrahydrofolate reductase [NAD(P)H] [Odoribacteraceae bacterium]